MALQVLDTPEPLVSLDATEAGVEALLAQRQDREAAERVKRAEQRWRGEPALYLMRARILGRAGNGRRKRWRCFARVCASFTTLAALATDMQLLLSAGQLERARKLAQTQIENTLSVPPRRRHTGMLAASIYARQNLRSAALREYQKARESRAGQCRFSHGTSRPYTSRWETWPGPAPSSRRRRASRRLECDAWMTRSSASRKRSAMGRRRSGREQLLGPPEVARELTRSRPSLCLSLRAACTQER